MTRKGLILALGLLAGLTASARAEGQAPMNPGAEEKSTLSDQLLERLASPGRDPFRGPLDDAQQRSLAGGLAGTNIQDLVLLGIVNTSRGPIALIQAQDQQMYVAEPGQQLANGRLTQIQADSIVCEEEPHDTLGNALPTVVHTLRLHSDGLPVQRGGRIPNRLVGILR